MTRDINPTHQLVLALAATMTLMTACGQPADAEGDDASNNAAANNNATANNTSVNNAAANNATSNNAATNNTASNNAAENNTAANNTSANNASANNTATNNTSANNTTSNNASGNNTSANNSAACDPEATQAELLGQHDAVAAATLEVAREGDVVTGTLDASLGGPAGAAMSSYAYLDLQAGELVELSDIDALDDATWDVAFRRTEIRVNSGDSGPGAIMIAPVEGTTWEEAAPPMAGAGWSTDEFIDEQCEVATFGRGSLATAFGQWYDYDPSTHTVSPPEGVVYFLYDAATHAVVKFQIEAYDDGVYTLRWAPLMGGHSG